MELVIKTAMPKGTTIPKGRLTWPREAKPQSEETILVFAEGRQAEEAKRAGAHIVGGLELVDDVSTSMRLCPYPVFNGFSLPRLSAGDATRLPYSVFRVSFVQSLQNSVVCSVQGVLCLRRGEGQ